MATRKALTQQWILTNDDQHNMLVMSDQRLPAHVWADVAEISAETWMYYRARPTIRILNRGDVWGVDIPPPTHPLGGQWSGFLGNVDMFLEIRDEFEPGELIAEEVGGYRWWCLKENENGDLVPVDWEDEWGEL